MVLTHDLVQDKNIHIRDRLTCTRIAYVSTVKWVYNENINVKWLYFSMIVSGWWWVIIMPRLSIWIIFHPQKTTETFCDFSSTKKPVRMRSLSENIHNDFRLFCKLYFLSLKHCLYYNVLIPTQMLYDIITFCAEVSCRYSDKNVFFQ